VILRARDRLVHRLRHGNRARRSICLQHRDRTGARFHPHVGGGVDGLGLQPFDVTRDPQHPVRVNAPQIRPHQRLRPFIRHGRRNARRGKQRACEALEIGAWNNVQFAVRRHHDKLQEFSRSDLQVKSQTISIRRGSSSNNPDAAMSLV